MTTPNISERYLSRLCQDSFLRLWSWPHIYRDQRVAGGASDGKEVCDLLGVFGEDVFIFSDKYCQFPSTGDTKLDWSRWFRRAVKSSAKQVRGAERWIRAHPERIFLDAACSKPFPIPLPNPARANYHRIVVAHGAGSRCREEFGGSGSLMMIPELSDDEMPFAVGKVGEDGDYVHVVDDFTLDAILGTVDTVADLAQYLRRKEQFITSGKLKSATGEEEILAHYLKRADAEGLHYFEIPEDVDGVVVDEGHWESFQSHPDRLAQIDADRISYAWDQLIDEFAKNILAGTQYFSTTASLSDQEVGLRFMAAENRLQRRVLANALMGVLEKGDRELRAARIVAPMVAGKPYYVFLSLQWPENKTEEEYRMVRRGMLEAYCMAVRAHYPDAAAVLGVATEPLTVHGRSEDFLYLDGTEWTDELQKDALERQSQLKILQEIRPVRVWVDEYPQGLDSQHGRDRNKQCPCGSGRKLKKCHGLRHRN